MSGISAYIFNEINLSYLKQNIPEKVRQNETVVTSDDISYLRPPQNYLKTNKWKDNSVGKQSYFIRPPGYGILYYAGYFFITFCL